MKESLCPDGGMGIGISTHRTPSTERLTKRLAKLCCGSSGTLVRRSKPAFDIALECFVVVENSDFLAA